MTLVRSLSCAAASIAILASVGVAQGASFTGFHLGVDLALNRIKGDTETYVRIVGPAQSYVTEDSRLEGAEYGIHAGYTHDFGGLLVGLEASYSANNADDQVQAPGVAAPGPGGVIVPPADSMTYEAQSDIDVVLRLGGRIGNSAAFFMLAGASWLDIDAQTTPPAESAGDTLFGYTLGAQVEVMLFDGVSGRVQYRYSFYDDSELLFPVNNYQVTMGPQGQSLGVGLS